MWHETTMLLFSETHRTRDKMRPNGIRRMKRNPALRADCYLISSLLCFIFIHFVSDGLYDPLSSAIVCGGFCRGAALFCLLTALLPVLGLADAEVSPRWLIVYGHLSAWPPVCHVATCYRDLGLLGGSRNLGGGLKGWGKGRFAGASASSAMSVWTAVLSCWTWIPASQGLTGLRVRLLLSAVYSVALWRRWRVGEDFWGG